MSNFQKVSATCILLVSTLLCTAPARAQNPRIDIKLTTTGVMQDVSGTVAIYPSRNGSETVAIRVNSLMRDGTNLRVTVVQADGTEADVALMTLELGTAYFSCNDFKAEPSPLFPTAKIQGFFVYYKDQPILEGKYPGN